MVLFDELETSKGNSDQTHGQQFLSKLFSISKVRLVMGLRRSAIPILLLVLSPLTVCSQAGLLARPTPAPEYALGAGDQIMLHVIDMGDISDKPIRIDPNGFVDIPLAGKFRASGLTLDQFKLELAARLGKYITNPEISVNLTPGQSRAVSLIGCVKAPGTHDLDGPKRLIEAISLAGGVDGNAGPRVILTREQKWGKIPLSTASVDPISGSSTAWVSLDDLLGSKNPSDNILIAPNDIISIPKAEIVYVYGSVKKAGGFQLSSHPTISVLQALSLAEGMDRDASPHRAKILRPSPGNDGKPKEIPVDISQITDGKVLDPPLQGNDVLFIPGSSARSGARRAADAILQVATGLAIYRF